MTELVPIENGICIFNTDSSCSRISVDVHQSGHCLDDLSVHDDNMFLKLISALKPCQQFALGTMPFKLCFYYHIIVYGLPFLLHIMTFDILHEHTICSLYMPLCTLFVYWTTFT